MAAPPLGNSDLVGHFTSAPSGSRKEGLAATREYTEAPIRQGRLESPGEGVVGGAVLREVDPAKAVLAMAKVDLKAQTDAQVLARAGWIAWERTVWLAEAERRVKWGESLERHGDWRHVAVLGGPWRCRKRATACPRFLEDLRPE